MLPLIPRAALNPEIEKFNSVVGDKSNYILNDSQPLDARGPDGNVIACDPDAIAAQYGIDSEERRNCVVNPASYVVSGVQRSLNSVNAGLTTLVLPAVNAGNIEVQGIDLSLGYRWSTDYGDFRSQLIHSR